MSSIIDIGLAYDVQPTRASSASTALRTAPAVAAGTDTVELSPFGRALARAAEQSSLSIARTRAIRAEIANGTFETPERIAGTIDRLLDILI